jgi:hypothetical protein
MRVMLLSRISSLRAGVKRTSRSYPPSGIIPIR